jgi:short-subunit dehydrogenase
MTTFKEQYGPWALVAGASEGLGEAFAEQIAAKGINVALVARREALLNTLRDKLIAKYRVEVRTIPLDLAREDAVSVISDALQDVKVGLLVYNAALSVIGPFMDRPLADHLNEITINCRTPMSLAYIFGRQMQAQRRGGIILMSSLSALQGSANIANYTATKAYNMILGEGLWEELRRDGVDVLACAAGAISTPNYVASLANGNASKGSPAGAMSPETVVTQTLAALGKEGSFFPGFSSKAAAFVMRRLMPHGLAVRIMGRVMRQLYGS